MNKFGLHTFGLPSFGISDFRLTSFGGDGDGGRKAAFHNSLVDAWFMSGYSNSDKPKEIVGVRGNAIELKNFLYAKNSGFGKYTEDFMSRFYISNTSPATIKEKTTSSITISKLIKGRGTFEFNIREQWNTYNFKGYSIKVEGYPPNMDSIEFYCIVTDGGELHRATIKGDGIYTLNDHVYQQANEISRFYHGLVFNTLADVDCNLTITQIPEVEGSLCFDGVDDYGIWEEKPLLTDFTIICKREWVDPTKFIDTAVASTRKSNPTSDGAFAFEKISQGLNSQVPRSFGTPTDVPTYVKTGVTYMTPTDYNGTAITKGGYPDNNLLLLGAGLKDASTSQIKEFFNGSIYYFAMYNKSLSPKEIEEEKIKLEQKWKSKLK